MTKKLPLIALHNVHKTFEVGDRKTPVLKGIDLEVFPGEFVLIYGPSGCGKSTLLNTIVGLERPTSGDVIVEHKDFYERSDKERAKFRREFFGAIYQQSNWIGSLNVVNNVALPLCIIGKSERYANKKAMHWLTLFKLDHLAKGIPTELSGGEQQRVSVTRALVTSPPVLIADEPTGSLDSTSASDLMYVLQVLNTESFRTVIMVSHNPSFITYATKIVMMEDGKITSVTVRKEVDIDTSKPLPDIMPAEKESMLKR